MRQEGDASESCLRKSTQVGPIPRQLNTHLAGCDRQRGSGFVNTYAGALNALIRLEDGVRDGRGQAFYQSETGLGDSCLDGLGEGAITNRISVVIRLAWKAEIQPTRQVDMKTLTKPSFFIENTMECIKCQIFQMDCVHVLLSSVVGLSGRPSSASDVEAAGWKIQLFWTIALWFEKRLTLTLQARTAGRAGQDLGGPFQ